MCHINLFFEWLLGNKSFLWPAVLTEAEAKCFGDCLCLDNSHHSLIMESEGLWNVGLQIWTHLVCYKRRIYQLQHESFFLQFTVVSLYAILSLQKLALLHICDKFTTILHICTICDGKGHINNMQNCRHMYRCGIWGSHGGDCDLSSGMLQYVIW